MKPEQMITDDNHRSILLDVAFLDYCRFSNITDADIALLYERVEQIKKDYEDDKDYALEAMVQYDLENIHSKEDLKQRIKEQRAKITAQIIDTQNFGSAEKTTLFISSYLKKLGFKKDAGVLATAIVGQRLNEDFDTKITKADKLANLLSGQVGQLKQNLATHFKEYQQSNRHDDVVETLVPSIEDYISGLERSVTFNFLAKEEDKPFRNLLRDDFNHMKNPNSSSDKDGVKPAFLKMYGHMMEAGLNVLNGQKSETNYNSFKHTLQSFIGQGYETELLQAFGAKDMAECERKFYEKSKNLYVKTIAALLSKKKEYDAVNKIYTTDVASYIQNNINSTYIRGLKQGYNKVSSLGLVEDIGPDARMSRSKERELNKELLGDLTDRQHVSVHHRITIGSAKDIIIRIMGKSPFDKMRQMASDMVNTLGNIELVVGKEKHQSLEPNKKIVLTAEKSHAIFEARLSPQYMAEICNNKRIAPNLLKELEKLKNQTDIAETLNFSESAFIVKIRPQKAKTNRLNLFDKIRQYFRE